MRILGIDPGSRFLGLGMIEHRGGRAHYVTHAVLSPSGKLSLAERLAVLYDGIAQLISAHAPDQVAVETVFHAKFARSALVLAHARGAALVAASRAGLPVFEYPPSTIKKAIGASGRADKEAVARLVSVLLEHPELERSDCSDALACALCHAGRSRLLSPQTRNFSIVRRS